MFFWHSLLDLHRHGSESQKKYMYKMVSRVVQSVDQRSVVSFVIKKLLCIYLR